MEKDVAPKKLYTFAMKIREVSKVLNSEEEFNEFMRIYDKYYRKKGTRIIFSNLKVDRKKYPGKIYVSATELHRIENKTRPLEEIDKISTESKNSVDLKLNLGLPIDENLPLVIAYKNKGTYKTLPILYSKNKEYTDYGNLVKEIIRLAVTDNSFLKGVNTSETFNKDKSMSYYLENVLIVNSRYNTHLKTESIDISNITRTDLIHKIKEFIDAWCKPKDKNGHRKFSYRRFRDLINYIIEYRFKQEEIEKNNDKEKYTQLNLLTDFGYKLKGEK